MKIKSILIANRGEIAIRIIRTAKKMGIRTFVIKTAKEPNAWYLDEAAEIIDFSECFDDTPEFLDIERIIYQAKQHGVDSIHPGYGFLAENPDFAEACETNNIIFIGPPSEVIQSLGNKVTAREIMKEAGIPLVPGTQNLTPGDAGVEEAVTFADTYGYPVMLKATAGGGGRGIRRIENQAQLVEEIPLARSEAKAAFNNDAVYLEKVVLTPKHIEVQIIADKFGNTVHLGSRDCSIQR
ncbi:MAG: biotin carboxylase, partial [Bacteroidales bacterium]|nr:biotin carboxylase [Bacteroidales bacterium]